MELAQRCLAGDPHALREFVETFEQQVFGICLRMLRHRQDAEDVAQESLVRAVRYLGSWDPAQPLAPWVLKIAANRCRTALSRRNRTPLTCETGVEPTCRPADSHGLAEELELALKLLNSHQRACFELFYLREMSVEQVSAEMEIPQGTVKTWLHRSRKILATHLRERGVSPRGVNAVARTEIPNANAERPSGS